MREVLDELERWDRRGDRIAIATVVSVSHSAPRPAGAKLLVSATGEVAGSVSGGCVEAAVIEVAEEILAGAPAQLLRFGVTEDAAWEVGLPCGGEIEVFVELYVPGVLERAARTGERAVAVTVLEGDGMGTQLLLTGDGEVYGTFGDAAADGDAVRLAHTALRTEAPQRCGRLFLDVVTPEPQLILFGAGDISVALCRLARTSGWRPYVIDPRARFATPARFPDAIELIVDWPEPAFARLGGIAPSSSIVVLTHDSKLDDSALTLALASPARFIGAMGSRQAHARRCTRLTQAGVNEAELARISAPLGLDLGAVSREETALSIFAEVVAARHGRAGGRLLDTPGRIHDVGARDLRHA
jgi:xanthine dehydrogenase accessory factor